MKQGSENPKMHQMRQKISTSGLLRSLSILLAGMLLAALVVQTAAWKTGHWGLYGLTQLVDMDAESSIPNWFNSFELFLVSLVCWMIARHPAQDLRWRPNWAILSGIFFLMSFDEVACVHEFIGRVITEKLQGHGLLYYGFALPGAILAMALFIYMLRMLLSLPKKIAFRMVLAGFLYVLGAAGLDAIQGIFAEKIDLGQAVMTNGAQFAEKLMSDLEGMLEMGSLIFFLKVLFDHLKFIGGKEAVDCQISLEP